MMPKRLPRWMSAAANRKSASVVKRSAGNLDTPLGPGWTPRATQRGKGELPVKGMLTSSTMIFAAKEERAAEQERASEEEHAVGEAAATGEAGQP